MSTEEIVSTIHSYVRPQPKLVAEKFHFESDKDIHFPKLLCFNIFEYEKLARHSIKENL